MPARSRWVRRTAITVAPSGAPWPWRSARPSSVFASRPLTSSESRSSISASRDASRSATCRSSAEEPDGVWSRNAQKASRPIAQAKVSEVALPAQEGASRVGERCGPLHQRRQALGRPAAEDRAGPQGPQQRTRVGGRPAAHRPPVVLISCLLTCARRAGAGRTTPRSLLGSSGRNAASGSLCREIGYCTGAVTPCLILPEVPNGGRSVPNRVVFFLTEITCQRDR